MPERILIVDDESRPRASLAAGLRLADFEVAEAASADAALQILRGAPVHVAIVDLMSGFQGLELARQIRDDHPRLPLVLTSAHCLARDQIAKAKAGALAFVPKPYRLDAVTDLLRKCALSHK